MLKVIDIHTYYGDSHVLQGVSLELDKGSVIGILGRNGMGKTTLISSIIGFTPPKQGKILLGGVDITHVAPHLRARMNLGLVPQGRRIFPSLSVMENLRVGIRKQSSGKWTEDRILSLLPRLKERGDHKGNELSGGEQQMLAIARALMTNPSVLLMDEPTEGLAPLLVADIGKIIGQLKDEGLSILLVEQNVPFALKMTDYVHVLSKGTIVHSSLPDELWDREDIKTQYLGL
ncbi:MAG: ABC transporter ATP-binding protein [Proteobacteria bacterium]|nr:ABC transporter ATP-binding protein [Pseudomonadota bacterium]